MKNDIPQDLIDQYGFTLIELMISLVLGLLISAAVMQVFLTSQRVDRIQTAGSEIQDKAVFGLQSIESQVRLANLGNDGVAINDTTAMGGIVLTAGDYSGSGEGSGSEGGGSEGGGSEGGGSEGGGSEGGGGEGGGSEGGGSEDGGSEGGGSEGGGSEGGGSDGGGSEGDDGEDGDEKTEEQLEKELDDLEDELDGLEELEDDLEDELEELEDDLEDARDDDDTEEVERIKKEWEEKKAELAAKREEIKAKENEIEAKETEIERRDNYSSRVFQRPDFQRADFRVSDFQIPVFQRAGFQRIGFQRVGFQKVAASSASGLFNVMVKGGLGTGYLTRSGGMTSEGGDNKWGGLSNTNQPSDQLTIQYINTTGRILYDCEGTVIAIGERVITRYFVADGGGAGNNARKNLDLRCDAGRITSDGTLKDFTDSGAAIIENIDQFNIRLGIQRSRTDNGNLIYEYADLTVADYMALGSSKPAITNIRIAILARSTANSPEASGDVFEIFGKPQTLKEQDNPPKYLRRVYESNILLRNARIMRIIDTTIV